MFSKKNIRNAGRYVYKKTGYKNPMKKGVLSSSRILKQLPKLATDVLRLKSMVNAEKKRLEVNPTSTFNVAQVNGNNSGHFLIDLTPNVSQGIGFNNKIGNSIKWHSSFLDMQFSTQNANISGQTLKIEIVKVVGQPFTTVSDVLGRYIEPTAFIGGGTIYDLHSPRDPDYFKNYVVLHRRYVKIPEDSISSQMQVKRIQIGLKLKNHHVRTNDNDPTLTMGQVFMIITADQGNFSTSTASTLAVPTQAVSTGVDIRYQFVHYFYDN
nr:capsid protein [Cressdnaviricota sp.]